MKIKKYAAACVALMAVLTLFSCGDSGASTHKGENVRLDGETDRMVSTFTIGSDSFTLPCNVSEFLDKGYSLLSENGTQADPDGIMVPGKASMSTFYAGLEGGGLTRISVENTDVESKPLRYCKVTCFWENYLITLAGGSPSRDWTYMGLTTESKPEDVVAAFDGILELETSVRKDSYDLYHQDRDRNIRIEFRESGGEYIMTDIYIKIYPTDEVSRISIDVY